MVSVQFVKVVNKKPEEFTRKYCHKEMHKKDYRVAHSVKVREEFAHALAKRDAESWDEAECILRRQGLVGTFIVQINRGGPGRPPKWEFLSRPRPSGITQVGRIRIESREEEYDDYW